MDNQDKPGDSPSLLQVLGSVLAAGFGVQSTKNRERDFQHGNMGIFIAVGAAATVAFILLIYGVVRLVLG
jgi:hypothetical protein